MIMLPAHDFIQRHSIHCHSFPKMSCGSWHGSSVDPPHAVDALKHQNLGSLETGSVTQTLCCVLWAIHSVFTAWWVTLFCCCQRLLMPLGHWACAEIMLLVGRMWQINIQSKVIIHSSAVEHRSVTCNQIFQFTSQWFNKSQRYLRCKKLCPTCLLLSFKS